MCHSTYRWLNIKCLVQGKLWPEWLCKIGEKQHVFTIWEAVNDKENLQNKVTLTNRSDYTQVSADFVITCLAKAHDLQCHLKSLCTFEVLYIDWLKAMSLKRVPVKGGPEGTFIKSGNPNKEAQQSEMLGFKDDCSRPQQKRNRSC